MFGYFVLLRQNNLAPASPSSFDPSRHTSKVDMFVAPPGLLLLVRRTNTHQTVGNTPVLLIPGVPGQPTYQVAAYQHLLILYPLPPQISHSSLTTTTAKPVTVTIFMLARALSVFRSTLGLDPGLFSLHSLQRRTLFISSVIYITLYGKTK